MSNFTGDPHNDSEVIQYLSTLPLNKLRKRQDIIRSQIKIACDSHKIKVLAKLQKWYDQTSKAINLKEFGNDGFKY